MNKTVNILSILVCVVLVCAIIYQTFAYRSATKDLNLVKTTKYREGNITYLIFSAGNGHIDHANYTADSVEFEISKRFVEK